MDMFYFAEEDEDLHSNHDNNNNDNGGVHLPESNQSSHSTKSDPPHHSQGDDNVIFVTRPASQQSTSTVDVLLSPIDEEPNDRPEDNTEGYEPIPREPVNKVQNKTSANAELPFVAIEQYVLGFNDMMSGAVSPLDQVSTDVDQDDNIVCADEFVRQRMPYKVLRRDELFHEGLPFVNDHLLWELPEEFMTTYRGLDRAVEEFYQFDEEAFASDMEADVALLGMIIKRGGLTENRAQQVVYPEDIVPLPARENPLQGFAQELDSEDLEYWVEVGDLGLFWNELDIP
ncbi:hypothetical protein AYL99_09288 [Fonsecaea erecta]|uniref:Uncharacterized protein n=1 Tax=Fonsecaea erecta TaxID=1367422 RepID=A0A178Z8J5_9EURO|nr:hypothetical protein AYL99_09288 [Fonsecaea erecta]OAP56109.1 hypothetical protein AYL99_09288 [Fonsecaea erecta]